MIRKCKTCGLEANNIGELYKFKPHNKSKYKHENVCIQCFNNKYGFTNSGELWFAKSNPIKERGNNK